ncbi:hypothetical protein PoB_007473500 [Plakobranchus ocellatus]|uniref:Uncharacterized protein n=1 Tax=Plakobranchus ocellatus TaxID=259542 RepID=A0AAV4DW47_9GAST|nr:hypothetical protein PoB_007473500 [Plakobranchus ocellatus]
MWNKFIKICRSTQSTHCILTLVETTPSFRLQDNRTELQEQERKEEMTMHVQPKAGHYPRHRFLCPAPELAINHSASELSTAR